MKRVQVTVAAAAVGLVLAGCGGGGGSVSVGAPSSTAATPSSAAAPQTSTETSPDTSSPASTQSSSSVAQQADFAVGQCYNDTVNWQLTSCDQDHKLEISAVVDNDKFTSDLTKRSNLRTWTCNSKMGGYLGSTSGYYSRILSQPVPSSVDSKTTSRIVCAVALVKADDSGYQVIDYALKNTFKTKGYAPYRLCTPQRPSSTDSPTIVPCSEKHKGEMIGGYVIGKANSKYPGEAKVDKVAYDKCKTLAKRYLGGVTRSDVVPASNHSGAGPWAEGITLTGCFVEVTKGTVVKPLKNIKKQSLSKFQ